MKPKFDGRSYGPLGFSIHDGPTVCYSFYEVSLLMNDGKHDYKHKWKTSERNRMVNLKTFLLERDNYRCKYCKCRLNLDTISIDHYFPKWYWGDDADRLNRHSNLVASCRRCNYIKGKKLPWDVHILQPPTSLSRKILVYIRRKRTHAMLFFAGKRTLKGKRIPYTNIIST